MIDDKESVDLKVDENDIVAKILAERKAHGVGEPKQPETTVITNDTFFRETTPMGWMTKQQFKDVVINGLSGGELNDLKMVLEKLSSGESYDFKPLAWSKNGKAWYFLTFTYKKGTQKYKLPAVGIQQTETFLILYQAGNIVLQDVSLEGLFKVAMV